MAEYYLLITRHWEIMDELGQTVDSYYGYPDREDAADAAIEAFRGRIKKPGDILVYHDDDSWAGETVDDGD